MKRLVRDLIHQKGLDNFTSISPETSIFEALGVLTFKKCSALLVVEHNKLQGIFSEKDFARASIKKNSVQLYERVGSIMTSKVYYAEPTFSLEECLQVMSKARVRYLPVLDNDQPIALVSMRHIMEVLVEDKNTQIRDLTTYITGSGYMEPFPNQVSISIVPVYSVNKSREA